MAPASTDSVEALRELIAIYEDLDTDAEKFFEEFSQRAAAMRRLSLCFPVEPCCEAQRQPTHYPGNDPPIPAHSPGCAKA